jgi:hypothetical protein
LVFAAPLTVFAPQPGPQPLIGEPLHLSEDFAIVAVGKVITPSPDRSVHLTANFGNESEGIVERARKLAGPSRS